MQVFKFGGASVKDANGVKNLAHIVQQHLPNNIVIVVSAMGKITNALEELTNAFFKQTEDIAAILEKIKKYHYNILNELFTDTTNPVFDAVNNIFVSLEWELEDAPSSNYDKIYDQIVAVGELVSTTIVAAYLNNIGVSCKWLDARDIIKTDDTYREGKVSFEDTQTAILQNIKFSDTTSLYITQGFIGANDENYTTTLGREGSDYTASIIAFCLTAEKVTIWKDVPGVLNADPKYFADAVLLKELSYQDAVELTYYGATVIHPKTIKPLQNKNIPLYVRSFINPELEGTTIGNYSYHSIEPSYIFKRNQLLISISPRDFSFIVEENISKLFALFSEAGVKVHLLQNSALNFSVVVDNTEKAKQLIEQLKKEFRVLYNENVELITIRYYTQVVIDKVTRTKKVLLEHRSRNTAQIVVS